MDQEFHLFLDSCGFISTAADGEIAISIDRTSRKILKVCVWVEAIKNWINVDPEELEFDGSKLRKTCDDSIKFYFEKMIMETPKETA